MATEAVIPFPGKRKPVSQAGKQGRVLEDERLVLQMLEDLVATLEARDAAEGRAER